MPETFEGMEAAAVREIRELVLDLKDNLLMKLLRSGELSFIDIVRARDALDNYRSDDLAAEMEEILSKYARWSYEDGLNKIDGMLNSEDLGSVLHLPPANIEIAKTFKADKIKTIAPQLLEEVNAQLSLAFVGERTPQEISSRIASRFDVALFKAERIVRTETKGLQNQAEEARIQQAFSAGRSLGIPLIKTWLHSSGAQSGYRRGKRRAKYTPRPHHKAMHGVTVKEGEKFTLVAPTGTFMIDGPHAEPLPAEEVINCYCDRGIKIDREAYRLRPQTDERGFPLDPDGMKVVKNLGGTTGAMLVEDPRTGQKYVRKTGNSPEHIREEATADSIYQAAGIKVPDFKLFETPDGPVKLAKYIEDATPLSTFLKQNSMRTKAAKGVVSQLQEGFAADALLGNWDVVGLDMDNVLVDKDGTAWRIDNGGSMRFRAQGTKKTPTQWNGDVSELESLRSKAMNAQTAKIFGTLTDDDVRAQIQKLAEKRDAILAAAKDSELQETLGKRFDFLENWATPKQTLANGLDAMKSRLVASDQRSLRNSFDAELPEDIERARGNGVAVATDRNAVEDGQVLLWEETNRFGEKVLKARLRVTADGDQAMRDALSLPKDLLSQLDQTHSEAMVAFGASKTKIDPDTPVPHPDDSFFQPFLGLAKTVAHHNGKGDFEYNESKFTEFAIAVKKLEAWDPKDAWGKQVKAQYEDLASKLSTAYDSGKKKGQVATVPHIEQPTQVPPKKKSQDRATAATEFTGTSHDTPDLSVEQLAFFQKRHDKGRLFETNVLNLDRYDALPRTAAIHARYDDAVVKFQSMRDSSGNLYSDGDPRIDYAFRGEVEFAVRGGAAPESIARLRDLMNRHGIPAEGASPEYMKALVIVKTANLKNSSKLPEMLSVMRDSSIDDKVRLDAVEKLGKAARITSGKRNLDDALPRANQWGEGYGFAQRTDIERDEIQRYFDDNNLAVLHYSSKLSEFVRGLVNQGGTITSTRERYRIGVSIARTGGKSPEADRQTGGASYFFTRILSKNSACEGTIEFDSGIMMRPDAVSYPDDKFGRVLGNYRAQSVSTLDRYKQNARHCGNETNFKDAIPMFSYVKRINAGGQREQIISYLKQNGYEAWPDGRDLRDVVH